MSMGGCGGGCHGSRGGGAVAGGGGGGWDAVALNGGGWGPVDEAALDVVAGVGLSDVGLSDGDLYPVYLGAVAGALSKGD